MIRTILKILLPLVFIAAGAGVAYKLIKSKPRAERAKMQPSAMVVSVHVAEVADVRVEIEAQGTVTPDRVVQISPQVAGLVAEVAPGLDPGARVQKGDMLVRIDDRDLRFAIKQREAEVVRATFEYDVERGRSEVAGRDWEMLGEAVDTSKLGASLARRKPHIDAAKARVDAAKSALEQARVDLARATVVAPFDAIVRERRVAEGQLVSPATPLAVLVATDRFFVTASIPYDRIAHIDVPGVSVDEDADGAPARIFQHGAGEGATRQGRVIRLLGDLDPNGRMARVIVAIDDPLGDGDDGAPADGAPADGEAPAGAEGDEAADANPMNAEGGDEGGDEGEGAVQAADDSTAGENGGETDAAASADAMGGAGADAEAAGGQGTKAPRLPLLLGAYVGVRIAGRTLKGAVELPRQALREGGRVWLRDADGRLAFRNVEVLWRQAETVVVRGLEAGAQVVLSRIAAPAPGQRLVLADEGAGAGGASAGAEPTAPGAATPTEASHD